MEHLSLRLRQIGLFLFAANFFISTAATNIGLVILLLAACIGYQDCWKTVKGQPLFYVSILFIAFLFVRHAFGFVYPEGQVVDLKPWVYLSLFWLIGWALGDDECYWRKILLLVAISFFIRLIIGFDLDRIKLSMSGGVGFGFAERVATIGFGLYAANLLIGWFFLRSELFCATKCSVKKRFIYIAWLICLVVIAEAFFLANSRGTWLALLAVILSSSLVFLIKVRKKATTIMGIALTITAVVLVVSINAKAIQTRVMNELPTYKAILNNGELEYIPYTSAGLRIHMYAHGIEMAKQRPLLGWGADSAEWVMSQSKDKHIKKFPHFHNGYIEVWVLFGLVGVIFFIVTFLLFIQGLQKARRHRTVDKSILVFLLSSFMLMIVWNVFNVRLDHHDYRIYSLLILGLAFAVISKSSKQLIDD